jgi:hypothetical protein
LSEFSTGPAYKRFTEKVYLTVKAISFAEVVTNLGLTTMNRATNVYFPFENAGALTLSPYSLMKLLGLLQKTISFSPTQVSLP